MKTIKERIQEEKDLTNLYLTKTYLELKGVCERMGIKSEILEEARERFESKLGS